MNIFECISIIESAEKSTPESIIVNHYNDSFSEDFNTIDDVMGDYEFHEIVDELLDEGMKSELNWFIEHLDIEYDKHESHGDDNAFLMIFSNGVSVFNNGNNHRVFENPDELIYDLNDDTILEFFNYDDQRWSDKFWESVGSNRKVYHATVEEFWPTIKDNGLEQRSDSRGITNRNTRSAVFVTTNIEELDIGTYGDVHLEINLSAMKSDGYMPRISQEEPYIIDNYRAAIANLLDVEYDHNAGDGISPDTLVIFGDIDPKYITRID